MAGGKKDRLAVRLNGGAPWGFRLHGGYGTGLPLTVHKVRRKSKAYKNLREGDIISSVNGHPCDSLTYEQVMGLADKSGIELCIEVLRETPSKENVDPGVKSTKSSTIDKHPATNTPTTTKVTTTSDGGFPPENIVLKKEEIKFTESTTKVTEQTEGMRIKSVSVKPDPISTFPTYTSNTSAKIKPQTTTQQTSSEALPPSHVICPPSSTDHSPFDTSTKSVSEEVSSDDRKYEKTTTESAHEKRGNTETTFMKKEHESIIKDSAAKLNDSVALLSDLESLLTNGLANFNDTSKNMAFDASGQSSKKETQTFSSFHSSSVKETSSNFNTDAQNRMADIISSLGLNSPFSDEKQSTMVSNLTANTTMTGDSSSPIERDSSTPLPLPTPKTKLRPFSDPCIEGLLERQEEVFGELPCIPMGTNSMFQQTTDSMFSTSELDLMTKKKKMFSSSSFYEEPQAIYPTVREQVDMARKIADSLADDTNRKSKGANMFFKRVKRSTKWVHEGPEPSDESEPTTPEIHGVEPPTPDPSKVPWKSKQGVTNLKLVLDPRHTEDAITLKSSGHNISEHNVVSPEICHGLVRALESPIGKGAALFAKRKKKSSEWVVDEEKVRNLMRAYDPVPQSSPLPMTPPNQMVVNPRVKLLKTPWEAALESPVGSCDAAFIQVNRGALADSVIRAAENKLQDFPPVPPIQEFETCRSPPVPMTPAAAYYDIYKPKAPKGWNGVPFNPAGGSNISLPAQPTYTTTNASPIVKPVQKSSSLPPKMVFQNFNTTPRRWKSPVN